MKYYLKENNNEIYIYFLQIEMYKLFICYVNNLNRNIGIKINQYNDKSCSLINIDIKNVKILINDFDSLKIDNCDICYETKRLYKVCNTCKHPSCLECLYKLIDMNCAFCRN